MIKIIFLDIDGVLNSHKWYHERLSRQTDLDEFDPNCVSLINKLTDVTGAKIVLSSSWRRGKSLNELKQLFKDVGITGELIGKTPILSFLCDIENYHYSVPRGNEIKAWIEINRYALNSKDFKLQYVIIDDESDMLYWQRNKFVQTNHDIGFTESDYNKCLKILN